MTRDISEELPDGLRDLLQLDDAGSDGPAAPLSDAQRHALVGAVLRDFAPVKPVPVPVRRRRPWLWVAAAMVLMVGSAAAYFVAAPLEPAQMVPHVGDQSSRGKAASLGKETPPAVEHASRDGMQRAKDLLAEANGLRAAGKFAEAAAVYLRAASEAQDPATGQVARVAAADLQLERLGDADAALRLYREASTLLGPLTPEAEAGVQRALRAVERPSPAPR